jgi:hypothetical protein
MKKISLLTAVCVSLVASAVAKDIPKAKSREVTFLVGAKSLEAQSIPSPGPLLQLLGTRPVLGRDFIKQDFENGSPRVAIISSALWVAATGSRPEIIGQKIKAGDQEYVVVGVAPKFPAPLEGMKVWLAQK